MQTDTALDAALAIENSNSLISVQAAVRRYAKPLGYSRFVLFSAFATLDGIIERIYWIEGDWFENGKSANAASYMRHCPVTHHILKSNEPFFWTKVNGSGEECYRIVNKPQGPGSHGLQIPVFGRLGLEGAMSVGGNEIDSSSRARLGMTMVATAAFFKARSLMEAPQDERQRNLTKREREILAWVAVGRRHAEIAATLKLSSRTVENHLRNIRRKLGVATTAEAIRVAIRNGDIDG
jgi:LuxR family transcriptional regulator (chaperone HchA-associated)